jgi:hypothetical protein
MTKRLFLAGILLPAMLLTGCEYGHASRLKNRTGQTIELTVVFNRKTFEDAWDGNPYIPFLQQYGVDTGIVLVAFDSVNLVSRYTVENNRTFSIGQAFGSRYINPDYDEFRMFRVSTANGSITLKKKRDFDRYFKTKDGIDYHWVLKR